MLSRRKLYLCALLFGILLLMIGTHTVQRSALVPASPANVTMATRPRPPVSTRQRDALVEQVARPCGCQSCVVELGRSVWFDTHFDPQQQPFLTPQNGSIDPAALRWWLALQQSADNVRPDEVIQKMFQVILPPSMPRPPSSSTCRSCAVVGNSGNLLGSRYGSLIDSHSSVIRMNKAVTIGFEKDVGTKTTYHFMYPESATDLAQAVHLVLLPFKLRDLQWVASALSTGEIKTTYMRVKERVKAEKDKVIVVNPAFFKYVHEKWTMHRGRYPSTGMLAIVFALHICDEVSVFGYGADQYGNWHHYWENNKYAGAFRKTGVHDADFEMEIIQRLNAEGKIKLK